MKSWTTKVLRHTLQPTHESACSPATTLAGYTLKMVASAIPELTKPHANAIRKPARDISCHGE